MVCVYALGIRRRALPSSLAPFAKPLPWLATYRHQHADAAISGVSEIEDPRKIPGLMEAMGPVVPPEE